MKTTELNDLCEMAKRINEIVRDHDIPGNRPDVLSELGQLTSNLSGKGIDRSSCAQLMSWARVFFSDRKWRTFGAHTVWNALREKAYSIGEHIEIHLTETHL